MTTGFTAYVTPVAANFHIAPQVAHVVVRRKISDPHWGRGCADVDERRSRARSHDGVFGAVLWVRPAPEIRDARYVAQLGQGHHGQEVHIITRVDPRIAVLTGRLCRVFDGEGSNEEKGGSTPQLEQGRSHVRLK